MNAQPIGLRRPAMQVPNEHVYLPRPMDDLLQLTVLVVAARPRRDLDGHNLQVPVRALVTLTAFRFMTSCNTATATPVCLVSVSTYMTVYPHKLLQVVPGGDVLPRDDRGAPREVLHHPL